MFDCSAVIPVYNRKDRIQQTIESVLNQSVLPREIIVVDDGSTDGTSEFVKSTFPDVKVVTQANQGVSAARNKGIKEAKGEWVAFLDSDDEWLPTKLEMQSSWLRNHPNIKICHCDEIWIRNQVRVNPGKRHKKQGGWIYLNCLPLCVISPSAVVINQEVFDEVGMFDENLPTCEDYDLWLRITQRFEVGYIDQQLLVKYGGHSDQLSKAYAGMDRFRITALVKSLEQSFLTSAQRKSTIETLIHKTEIYLNGAKKRRKRSEVNDLETLLERYRAELRKLE